MTDRQIQAVAEAIAKTLFTTHGFASSQPMTEVAQAAIEASDAKYVPMLVEAIVLAIKRLSVEAMGADCATQRQLNTIAYLSETLAQVPEEPRR